jgi:hypothetical protein
MLFIPVFNHDVGGGKCVAKTPLREYPDNLKITKTLVQLVRLSSVFFE